MRKWVYMRYRFLACLFVLGSIAMGQPQTTMSIEQLKSFIKSSEEFVAKKQMSDADIAKYLEHSKLTERLDDGIIEDLQSLGIGPKTLQALKNLKERTQALAAAPVTSTLPPKPIPLPSSEEQAAIIDEVREYVLNYDKSLPNYICTEVERRKIAPRPGTRYGGRAGGEERWQTMDELVSKLSYFEQKEDKKLILQNNAPVTVSYKNLGGATSEGDFGALLRLIFERASDTRFEWDHWGTLRTRRVMAFNYHVPQARSQWHLVVKDTSTPLDLVPAYHGLVEVDKETHQVLRVTLVADGIPVDFPIRSAEETLDYDYADISGQAYLLPLKGEVDMDGGEMLQRNLLEFHNYSKFTAESTFKYDIPPEFSADKTNETPDTKPAALDCKDPKNKDAKPCKPAPGKK